MIKNEYKRESSVQFVNGRVDIFKKKLQNKKQNEKGAYGLSPNRKIVCIQVPSIIYLRNWWLMIKKSFAHT